MSKKEKFTEETMEKELASEPSAEETATEETTSETSRESIEEREKRNNALEREKEQEEKAKEKIDELNDRMMRQMAEFDNFRKRSEKEKAQMFDIGAKSIIEKILPVIDNFERGLATLTPEEITANPFAQGIDKVYKQLMQSLSDAGVTAIEALGKEFDPELHNAVMHGEDEESPANTVVEEFQKGYKYREAVVRHSMVKVVN